MELHIVIRGKRSSWQDRTAGIPSGTFFCVAHVYGSVHYNTEVASVCCPGKNLDGRFMQTLPPEEG